MSAEPSRSLLGGTATALIALGVFFVTVLLADSGDNAYLYLAFSGGGLVAAGLPFALAALLPPGAARRLVTRVALGLVAVVGLLSLLLLLLGCGRHSFAELPVKHRARKTRHRINHVYRGVGRAHDGLSPATHLMPHGQTLGLRG